MRPRQVLGLPVLLEECVDSVVSPLAAHHHALDRVSTPRLLHGPLIPITAMILGRSPGSSRSARDRGRILELCNPILTTANIAVLVGFVIVIAAVN